MPTPEPRSSGAADSSTWSPPLPPAPGFEHRVVETPGLRSDVAAIGVGEPVVLLHGFPEHWWQWHAIARIDRATRLSDLLALFDILGIERAHLVSHDMGAITAIQLSYDHSERVRSAVQLSVPPAFLSFTWRMAPAFQHLRALIGHRPGASLHGLFSSRYVARPMPSSVTEAHDRFEVAYVDDAAHFLTDDAPVAVAELTTDWLAQAA